MDRIPPDLAELTDLLKGVRQAGGRFPISMRLRGWHSRDAHHLATYLIPLIERHRGYLRSSLARGDEKGVGIGIEVLGLFLTQLDDTWARIETTAHVIPDDLIDRMGVYRAAQHRALENAQAEVQLTEGAARIVNQVAEQINEIAHQSIDTAIDAPADTAMDAPTDSSFRL